jgi:uncharacterized Zn finger protein (UPF0148 family)
MPIKVKCECGQVLNVPEDKAGKSGKCPKCQKILQIPAAASAATVPAKPNAVAKATPSPAKSPAPTAPKAAVTKPVAAAAAIAPVANKMDSLFEEAGLTKKTGPVCPKCGTAVRPGNVMCTNCGLNFESGETTLGFKAAIEQQEFQNEFLQEAATNMVRDVQMDQRREKAGLPWWMLMSYLIGAIFLALAGVVIVDGKFGTPSAEGTFIGKIQRLPIFVTLGVTAMVTGTCIHSFAHLSIVVFGFTKSWGKGFGCLLVPFFSHVLAFMNWADNRQALAAIGMSIVTIGLGIFLIISGGGFDTLRAVMQPR